MATHAENFFSFSFMENEVIYQKIYKNNDNDRCIINMSDDN